MLDGIGICEKRVLAATATAAPQCTQLNESATAAPQCTQSIAVDVDLAPQRTSRKKKSVGSEDKIKLATEALVAALTEQFTCGNNNRGKRNRIDAVPACLAQDDSSFGIGDSSASSEVVHRIKDPDPFDAQYDYAKVLGLVTRVIPAGSPEFKSAGCKAALDKELARLRAIPVWREDLVEEWSEVRRKDPKAMVGRIFAIMGEKHSELAGVAPTVDATAVSSYKCRAVFGGNNIQVSDKTPAHELFTEVSGPPAAMATARIAQGLAAATGAVASLADAEQAFVQCRIDGPGRPKTWARLPKDWWPQSWIDKSIYDPVCPMERALYGHPESGPLWDKHLANILVG